MKKLENVVFVNENELQMRLQNFEQGQPAIQQIVDLIHSWQIGQVNTIDELSPLIVSPLHRESDRIALTEKWIDEKIGAQISESDIPKAGLFRLSKKSFVKMVDRPDPLPLVTLIAGTFHIVTLATSLAKIEKGKVIMDLEKYAALVDSYSLKAETPAEKTALKLFNELIGTLQKLSDMGALNELDLGRLKQHGFLAQTSGLSINPTLFRNIKSRLSHE